MQTAYSRTLADHKIVLFACFFAMRLLTLIFRFCLTYNSRILAQETYKCHQEIRSGVFVECLEEICDLCSAA